MKVFTPIVIALALAAFLVVPSHATTLGSCTDGATMKIDMSRSGSTVTTTVNVSPVDKNALYNVNLAFTPINTVANLTLKSSKAGVLKFTYKVTSRAQVRAWVMIDKFSDAIYCQGSATVN